MAVRTGLANYLSGVGFSAPEMHYRLKDGVEYNDVLPDASFKRINDVFHATLTHKNQFGMTCFKATIEEWNNFFLSIGITEMVSYGSFSRQLLDKAKEFSQSYLHDELEVREDRAADMDFVCYHPGADKKARGEDLAKVLNWIISKMYPNGDAPANEFHRLRTQLFINLSNKDGKGRFEHLKFLMFTLDSSIQLNGKDHPLKIDFIISGNHYPLLFNIDQFRISVTKFLKKERCAPYLKEGLQDILHLNQRRLIPNPEIRYDELSFIKRLNRSAQGFYLPFTEDDKFREVVFDPALHRKTKRKLTLHQIQQQALKKYDKCSISLTIFAFQLRLFLKKDLIPIANLTPILNPVCWQEKLINWMQSQLYNLALLEKIPTLSFFLMLKMVEGEKCIRIYEDALRVRLQVQKVCVYLFLPLDKLEANSPYAAEIKEFLGIGSVEDILTPFFRSQLQITSKEAFDNLFSAIKAESPNLLKTERAAIWILRAYQMGWVDNDVALSYSFDSDDYFNSIEQDPEGFGKVYLQRYPNTPRTLAYYATRPYKLDELKKSVPSGDFDTVLLRFGSNFDEILKRLKEDKIFFRKFTPDYCTQVVEELVFKRGHFELKELITHYLENYRNETSLKLHQIMEPSAFFPDNEAISAFMESYPFPVPASIVRLAIFYVLETCNKEVQIDRLHELFLKFRGERGEAVEHHLVFSGKEEAPKVYRMPENLGRSFYTLFYYEVVLQLLDAVRPVRYYDYIMNQFTLFLPDLSDKEIEAVIDRWLHVEHSDESAYILHYTTSLTRLYNYIEQTVSNTRIKNLKLKICYIAGIGREQKKPSIERFRDALDLFSRPGLFNLLQTLFIISNAPPKCRTSLSLEYSRALFDRSLAAFNQTKRTQVIESLLCALFGKSEDEGGACLFASAKDELRIRSILLLTKIDEECDQRQVTQESMNLLLCGIRLMQFLMDCKIMAIDEDLIYKRKAEGFIYTAIKYIQSSLATTDVKGAMYYIYKNSSLKTKFVYESGNFMVRYCSLT